MTTEPKEERTILADGRYELVEAAGEGGMATVWKAVMHGAAGFSRYVAIKRILGKLQTNREFVQMFVEEARVGSQLQHANIVQTIDFGQDDHGAYYLVLEWVEGVDFGHWQDGLRQTSDPLPWPQVVAIGVESLIGLGAAHQRVDGHGQLAPVIHRDVTPQNIMIGTNGTVKLSDFGLARAMDRLQMTHPDVVKGKLSYLAPEQTTGAPATVQSDLFSLAIVLWEALAGRYLYQGTTEAEVFLSARKAEIPSLGEIRPDLPPVLVAILEQALSREPQQRFASAQEMQRALAAQLRQVAEPCDAHALSQSALRARQALGLPEPRPVPPC